MNSQLIKYENRYDGQVKAILLNSPPSNVLTAKMIAEIQAALADSEKDAATKLVIIGSVGQNFSFGASVEEHLPEKVGGMLPAFHRMIGDLIGCKVPTLAQVQGFCLGGGFELALACGFIFADPNAKFAVPEIHLGVFPPVAAALLPFLGGGFMSQQMILTGERAGAAELMQAGLVTKVCDTGGLDAAVAAFIDKCILPKSASSLRIANQASRMTLADHYSQWISKLESLYLADLMSTHDAVEGIRAFTEKRQPKWTGN
ncbi:MAG: enoyl-CoA hydratase/isomerase family protein [Bdellovibrionota bacterium]